MPYGGFSQRLFLQSATVDLQEAVWTHMLANPDAASLAIQALQLLPARLLEVIIVQLPS